jgi:PIN domain nuclease of toxin-antitoxin system
MIFLDTHVLVWLYEGLISKFSKNIQNKLNSMELFISPMVELELNFLYEIGRINESGVAIVHYLNAQLNMNILRVDFYKVIAEAQAFTWTRDSFDRLIVATAALLQAPLITKDENIQQHYSLAIW